MYRPMSSQAGATTTMHAGFPKNDYAPRAGRKGRVIVDDPAKYPAKDNLGPFLGATGGWAGGEAALVKLREAIKEVSTLQKCSFKETGASNC